MTEAAKKEAQAKFKGVHIGSDLTGIVETANAKVEIFPDSNVVVFTNEGVQTKPAATAPAAAATISSVSASNSQ